MANIHPMHCQRCAEILVSPGVVMPGPGIECACPCHSEDAVLDALAAMYDADEARIAGEVGWQKRCAVAKEQAKAVLVERDVWGTF